MTDDNAQKTGVAGDAGKRRDVPFVTPLKMSLGDNGGRADFKSFGQVALWAQAEIDAWREIFGDESSEPDFERRIIEKQLATPRSMFSIANAVLKKEISVAAGTSAVRRSLTTYQTYECIHSNGLLGKTAKIMYRYEPMLMGLMAGATKSAGIDEAKQYADDADTQSYTLGYMMALQFSTTIPEDLLDGRFNDMMKKINTLAHRLLSTSDGLDKIDQEQALLQRNFEEAARTMQLYKTEAEQTLKRLIAEARDKSEKVLTAYAGQIDAVRRDYESQLAALRQSVSGNIRYGTALDYWNARLNTNQTKANQTTLWFVISGLFAVLTMIAVTVGLAKFSYLRETPLASVPLFLLIIGVTAGLGWMLYQSRTRYERAAQASQEKVSLLETLAALETEGLVNGDAQESVLEKVFAAHFPIFIEKQNAVSPAAEPVADPAAKEDGTPQTQEESTAEAEEPAQD